MARPFLGEFEIRPHLKAQPFIPCAEQSLEHVDNIEGLIKDWFIPYYVLSPVYIVPAAPEIIPQTCTIPLTEATPYPPIAALCKYANMLCAPTFPSID